MNATDTLYPKCKCCGGSIDFVLRSGEEIDTCTRCNELMLHELMKLYFKRRQYGDARLN